MPELTATEKRIQRLLGKGYRIEKYNGRKMVPLVPPGVVNSWEGKSVWVRRSTLDALKRKLAAPTEGDGK